VARVSDNQVRYRFHWKHTLVGLAALEVLTLAAEHFHADFAIAGFLFLLLVLQQSFSGDVLSAVLVSVAATICLDYYFVDPVSSFGMGRTADLFAVTAFLVTALAVTRLVGRVRAEATASRAAEEHLGNLYRLAQILLQLPSSGSGLMEAMRGPMHAFRDVFQMRAICLFDV
jgi:two-component system sensor histidine kinase KdpD